MRRPSALAARARTEASILVGCGRAESPRGARRRDGSGMSKRLGHLGYRIACLVAAAALGLAVYVAIFDGPTNNGLPISLLAGGGVLIWIVGPRRPTCRRALSGGCPTAQPRARRLRHQRRTQTGSYLARRRTISVATPDEPGEM